MGGSSSRINDNPGKNDRLNNNDNNDIFEESSEPEKAPLLQNSGTIGGDDNQENNDVNQKEKVEGKKAPANDEQNQKEKRIVPYKASEDKKDVNTDQKQALNSDSNDDLKYLENTYKEYLDSLKEAEAERSSGERIGTKIAIRNGLIQCERELERNKTSKGEKLCKKCKETIEKLNNELIKEISKEIDNNIGYYESKYTDKRIAETINKDILMYETELMNCLELKTKILSKKEHFVFFLESKLKRTRKEFSQLNYHTSVNVLRNEEQESNANDGQQVNNCVLINQNNREISEIINQNSKAIGNQLSVLNNNLLQLTDAYNNSSIQINESFNQGITKLVDMVKEHNKILNILTEKLNQGIQQIEQNTRAVNGNTIIVKENTQTVEKNLENTAVIQQQQQQLVDGQSEILKKVDETKELREDKKNLEKEKDKLKENNLFFKQQFLNAKKKKDATDVKYEKLLEQFNIMQQGANEEEIESSSSSFNYLE